MMQPCRKSQQSVCLFISALFGLVSATVGTADQIATITLHDGRTVRGSIDQRSDQHYLWLRTQHPNLVLVSRFPWSSVLNLKQGALPEGRTNGDSHAQENPDQLDGANRIPLERVTAPAEPSENQLGGEQLTIGLLPMLPPPWAVGLHDRPRPNPRAVRSLRLEVEVANWDHDAEPDGLRVLVTPLDYHGYTVPVDASIDFQLLTDRQHARGGRHVRRRREDVRLEEWSERMWAQDFGPHGAVYELPFRNFTVGTDFEIAPEAVLTARLGVAGSGAFRAKQTFILPLPRALLGSSR